MIPEAQNHINEIFEVGVYIRLSREDGDKAESESIVNQRSLISEYVKNRNDLKIYDFYIDDGFTGTDFNRPSFERMMTDIKNGIINCIIVKDLSRIGRNYIDTGQYLERVFPYYNVRFIAINDGIDNYNQRYDISVPIRNIVNAQYAEDISKKVISAMRTKQKEGKFIGAFPSYGYKKDAIDRNKLVIDEPAAEVVRRIYGMFRSGIGYQTIAKKLTNEGVLCPTDYKRQQGYNYHNSTKLYSTNYWTYSTVKNILQKRIYCGDMVQHTVNMSRYHYGEKRCSPNEWIVVENTHPAIIPRTIWLETQEMTKLHYRPTAVNSAHMFSGILKCKECGRGLLKRTCHGVDYLSCGTNKRTGSKYCTPHTVKLTELNTIVLNSINEHIQRLCNLENLVLHTTSNDKKEKLLKSKMNETRNSIEKIQGDKERLYHDYRDDILNRDEYIRYKKNYETEIDRLTKALELLETKQKTSLQEDVQSDWFQRLKSYGKIQTLTRGVINEFIEVIYVSDENPDKLTIEIKYTFQNKIKDIEKMAE